MSSDAVRQIKDRLDIVEVIADYVRLKKVGKNFRGLCPFHNEKTPSFYVSPERQTFHCFGCGEGGDVFTFLMLAENLDFREVLTILAEKSGVKLAPSFDNTRKPSLHDIMERANHYFRTTLEKDSGKMAIQYLSRRKVPQKCFGYFEIGWAPPGWDNLWKYLREEGVTLKEGLECGLFLEGKRGPYDRFRGRLMFPIRDLSGRLIAFGGRLVDGEGAKYINSPESMLYRKRGNLYLLHKAKKTIREKNRAIVVEGYMDALRLHISGYPEAVASLGTSLTEEQAGLIHRLTRNCYICFDSDTAGQEATIRSMYLLQQAGLDVFVVELPAGKDPDELLSLENGKKIFEKALMDAKPLLLYHLYVRKNYLEKQKSQREAINELLEGIARLPIETVSPYLNHLSRELGIFPFELQKRLAELRNEKTVQPVRISEISREADMSEEKDSRHLTADEKLDPLEASLLYILWNYPGMRTTISIKEILSYLSNEKARTVACAILSGESNSELEERWLSLGDTFPIQAISLGGDYMDQFNDLEGQREVILDALRRKRRISRFRELQNKMIRQKATREEMQEYFMIKSDLKDVIF